MLFIGITLTLMSTLTANADTQQKKVVCFYDSRSYNRTGYGKFSTFDLEQASDSCTHLVYGYAKLNGNDFELVSLNPDLDLEHGKDNYKTVTGLKRKFPHLKVLLSVGGWADTEDSEKYLTLLREERHRGAFVNSAKKVVQQYGFDGVDLAWQFPYLRLKRRNTISSIWHKIKKTLGFAKGSKDLQAGEHKAGFTQLIKEMNRAFKPEGHLVTASVIPHTNYTAYWDVDEIYPHVDALHLHTFDFLTADSKIAPELAFYPASLYEGNFTDNDYFAHIMVRWFFSRKLNEIRNDKLILGIPTFGRSWKINARGPANGYPPVEADGPGAMGHDTQQRGILSYPEICSVVEGTTNLTQGALRKGPSDINSGTYAFRTADDDREGMWVGYDDEEVVAGKAEYAKRWQLGGVAIHDITLDDFNGICTGQKYPLLKTAKKYITITK